MNSPSRLPGALLEISGNFFQACTLHAGVKLDIFSALNQVAQTAGQSAGYLKADQRGMV